MTSPGCMARVRMSNSVATPPKTGLRRETHRSADRRQAELALELPACPREPALGALTRPHPAAEPRAVAREADARVGSAVQRPRGALATDHGDLATATPQAAAVVLADRGVRELQ